MITMKLKGGLGNQLFQYALGRNLSLAHNTSLCLDLSSYELDSLRSYRLNSFILCDNLLINKNKFRRTLFNKLKIENRFLKNYFKSCQNLVTEKHFQFNKEILNTPDNSILDGYWQTEKYFKSIANVIRQDLILSETLSLDLLALERQIRWSNSIAVHVRRGDYVNNAVTTAYHGLCSLDWYQCAFEKMQTLVKDAKYFIFSDDPDWVKANLKLNAPTFFVPKSPDGKEAEDLYLMSQCKHNIIANSSFSWWAAWLNSNPEKNVIAPARWFAGADHDTKDLIPGDWIQI